MNNKYLALLILLFSHSLWAINSSTQDAVNQFCSTSSTQNANISILICDMTTGEEVASFRPNNSVPTASTMKVITTATALERLGKDFRFSTYLETDGTISDGVLNGNLYIRGTGDPTLGSQQVGIANFLPRWVNALKSLGIFRIKGSIIADVSFYDPAEPTPYNWIWEDIGNYYAPGIFPLTYKDNTMTIFLQSGAVGSKAEILGTDPYMPSIVFENYMVCGEGRDWLVNGEPYSNHRVLSGCITPNKGRWSVKAAIPNPPLLLAQDLTAALNKSGITIDSAASYTKQPALKERTILYTHQSETLDKIITHTNQHSDNLYAEQIFRYLGSLTNTPVLLKNCSEFEKQFWFNRAINLNQSFIFDGSGLSPQDAVSARSLVDILQYMGSKSSYHDVWLASLPVSGQSGTLRGFLGGTGLEGKVYAKSGTTSRVKAYAGYVFANDGHTYSFAILVNNASVKSKVVQREIAKLLQTIFLK